MMFTEDEVMMLLQEIESLIQSTKSHILRGMLNEYKFNIFHHLAGPACRCSDIDHVEERDFGYFIIESKTWGKTISTIQDRIQQAVLQANIPRFRLEHHIKSTEPRESVFRVNGGRTLDFDEWLDFMQYAKIPSESMGVFM